MFWLVHAGWLGILARHTKQRTAASSQLSAAGAVAFQLMHSIALHAMRVHVLRLQQTQHPLTRCPHNTRFVLLYPFLVWHKSQLPRTMRRRARSRAVCRAHCLL